MPNYMFIRIKKIKNNSYAYLVKSKRKRIKIKQKNLKYLGRVYKPQIISSEALTSQVLENKTSKDMILLLLSNELINAGFKEIKSLLFSNGELKADLNNGLIKNKLNNNIVLEINEGFICQITINSLLNYKFPNLDEKGCGIHLANTLLNCGIKLNQNLFIFIFNKLYSEI